MLWCPNSEILKISNFGPGRWLGPNDHLLRPWLKEKCYYFCKNFSYGHDLRINRMWKWLFWRPNSEDLKTQNFVCSDDFQPGRGRVSVRLSQTHMTENLYITGQNLKNMHICPKWRNFYWNQLKENCFNPKLAGDKVEIKIKTINLNSKLVFA